MSYLATMKKSEKSSSKFLDPNPEADDFRGV